MNILNQLCLRHGAFPALLVLAGLALASPSQGQVVNTRSLNSAYAQLVSFEAQPEIAAGRFSVEGDGPGVGDLDIVTAKLPLYREFPTGVEGRRWFLQATASYLDMEETLDVGPLPPLNTNIDFTWKGYGALLEGGMVWPLAEHFEFAPSFGLGVTRLESEADFKSSVLEDLLRPIGDGVLYNWDTLASVARGSLALRYDRDFSTWRVKARAHLSGSYIDSFEESRRFAGFSDEAGNLGLRVDVSHPLRWEIRQHPVHLIGHIGMTQFLGGNSDSLGFSRFGDVGVSLGLQKFALGVQGVIGSDLRGWNLLFNYDY